MRELDVGGLLLPPLEEVVACALERENMYRSSCRRRRRTS